MFLQPPSTGSVPPPLPPPPPAAAAPPARRNEAEPPAEAYAARDVRQASPPTHYPTAAAAAAPTMFCSACGEACASNEAFQVHVMEKHRHPSLPPPAPPPARPPAPATPVKEAVKASAPPLDQSPQTLRNVEQTRSVPADIRWKCAIRCHSMLTRRFFTTLALLRSGHAAVENRREVEYAQSPPPQRPVPASGGEPKPSVGGGGGGGGHPPAWSRVPAASDLTAFGQRSAPSSYYGHGAPAAAAAASSSMPMWPRAAAAAAYGDYVNPAAAMPAHWHQDPAAMAWIAASHQRLIMPHPHSAFHGPNGAHPALGRLASHSPSAASAGGGGAGVEDVLFPCDICGKHFTSKDVLRQVTTTCFYSRR